MKKPGVLLVNLGSPDAPEIPEVRTYLEEFLSDPRVIDAPKLIQQSVLRLAILPFRPKASAEAYAKIWTDEGSPLIIATEQLRDILRQRIDMPVEIGMRYGNPSTEEGIRRLVAQGVEHIFMIPLYPHYAMSSYETAVVKAYERLAEVAPDVEMTVQPPYFNDPDYIDALFEVARPYLDGEWDMLMMSYHGIPERHIRKGDTSKAWCLKVSDCCEKASPMHAVCYRAQCFATSRLFADRAGIDKDRWVQTFQSRLGPDPWLKPFTDHMLEELPSQGVKRLLVMCPAFVADCLETLEEIAMEGRDEFMEAGGEHFEYIPCLNTSEPWVKLVERFVSDFQEGRFNIG